MTVDPALLARVRSRLAAEPGDAAPGRLAALVRHEAGLRGDAEVVAVLRALSAELVGYGPLQPLLDDPTVTDVLVNGPAEVYVDRGAGLVAVPDVVFADEAALRRLVARLLAATGRRLDPARPFADAALPDGVRLHAVVPPIAAGPRLSLRVLRRRPFTVAELVAAGTLLPEMAALVQSLVRARLTFVVVGGTGTGKTTILGALLGLVDPAERLVVVEDTTELVTAHPHVVALQTCAPNLEGVGAVSLRELVRQALRMRPDRLVLGEARGAEVVDLLAACNTGHAGSAATMHANGCADALARFEALGVAAGLDRAAVHAQVVAGIDAVVALRRDRDGVRRVHAVAVVRRGADGARVVDAAAVVDGALRRGAGWSQLAERLAA